MLALNDRYEVYRVFDETGNVPVEYIESVELLKTDLLKDVGAYNQLDFSKSIARLYRDCSPRGTPGGSFSPALSQMPFMTALNNEVSMFGRFAVIALNFVYDRSFYRDRFGEVTGVSIFDGFNNVRFCPGERLFFINDRMSSAMFT